MNKADYHQNHNSTSINHFYEKLLLLKDMINTASAKKMAEQEYLYCKKPYMVVHYKK